MKPKIFTFLLTVVILTVVSGCLKKEIKPAPENNIKKSPIATTTDEKDLPVWPEEKYTEKDYEGWKTYINEKLGYKIKYPADWKINACDEGCSTKEVIINPPDAEDFTSYVSVLIEEDNLEKIKQRYQSNISNNIIEKQIFFSNQMASQFIRRNTGSRDIYVSYKNKIYDITTNKDQNQLVRQALASFEFID